MSTMDWVLHDGKGTFGMPVNPHDQQLQEATQELEDARMAPDVHTIRGRVRKLLALGRRASVLTAFEKWRNENDGQG